MTVFLIKWQVLMGQLVISNLIKSDGGQYYCIVTNEWGRSVESNDVILTVEGTYSTINIKKRK